jgi:hypothetical protein
MVSEAKNQPLECIQFGFFDYFLINIITEDFLLFSNSIHSIAINIVHVKSYSNDEVIMNNETRIKISRTKKMALIEAIEQIA